MPSRRRRGDWVGRSHRAATLARSWPVRIYQGDPNSSMRPKVHQERGLSMQTLEENRQSEMSGRHATKPKKQMPHGRLTGISSNCLSRPFPTWTELRSPLHDANLLRSHKHGNPERERKCRERYHLGRSANDMSTRGYAARLRLRVVCLVSTPPRLIPQPLHQHRVRRTLHRPPTTIQDVRVDHRGRYVTMTQ